MIKTLREQYPVKELCAVFAVQRSRFYADLARHKRVDAQREQLREEVIRIHQQSRGAAGSRTVSANLRKIGLDVGRYKARRLMQEAGVVSKQTPKHRYRIAEDESRIAPNHLERAFTVSRPDRVWCGDVTYIWAGKQWAYLAIVLDLYARRVVGWAISTRPDSQLTAQALRMAFELHQSFIAPPGRDVSF